MTETQWLTSEFPIPLLHFAAANRLLSSRKAKLFSCAYCRQKWDSIPTGYLRRTIELIERYADCPVSSQEVKIAIEDVTSITESIGINAVSQIMKLALDKTIIATTVCSLATSQLNVKKQIDKTNRQLTDLVREIFPYSDRPFDSAWRSGAVLELATGMYDSRDFAAMPILADSLEESGCHDAVILDHCRDSNRDHVKGCWAVDLVMGKQ